MALYSPWIASQFALSVAVGLSVRATDRQGELQKSAPYILALPIPVLGAAYIAYLHWVVFAPEPQFGGSDFLYFAYLLLVLWLFGAAVIRLALINAKKSVR